MTLAVVCALVGGHSAMYGPQASFFSELFGTRVRYSGASLGYQLAWSSRAGFRLSSRPDCFSAQASPGPLRSLSWGWRL